MRDAASIGSINIPGVGWKTLDEIAMAFRGTCSVSLDGYTVCAPTVRELREIMGGLAFFYGRMVQAKVRK